MSSILEDVKKLLQVPEGETVFDRDVVIQINAVFLALNQIGVGPEVPYHIGIDGTEVWEDFDPNMDDYEAIKMYVYLKVRKSFDPPGSGFVMTAMDDLMKEYEWRLQTQAERRKHGG